MSFVESTLLWQRWLLTATLVGSAVIILPSAVEPFMLPKATLVVALTVLAVALGAARALWQRRVQVPWSPVVVAVAVFGVALVVTTATSPALLSSVIGLYGRYTGLVPYLAYLALFLLTLRLTDHDLTRLLRRGAVAALGLVVGYGLLQAAGADPFSYTASDLGTTFSFLGNVNFSAAWAGSVSALALTTALSARDPAAWRMSAALLLPLTLLYTLLTRTAQGVVVAAVALTWTALIVATAPGTRLHGLLRENRGVVTAAGLGLGAVLLAGVGALFATSAGRVLDALGERGQFYKAAAGIFADNPVLGSGLDTYAHHFQAYRPATHALINGTATTDAPHSVLLGMFSNGGLLLGLTYLAVLVVVGWALVRGALKTEGASRLALAGFGGVWLGYQAQALISFDVPPLAVLHWVSAGVVVALGAPPRWRTVALLGPAVTRPVNRKGKAYGDYVVPASTRVLQALVAIVALGGLWLTAYPLRADLISASAASLTASGQFDEAVERFQRAAELNPSEPTYAFLVARSQEAAGRPQRALEAAEEAAARDPGTVGYALYAAQQARAADMQDEALRWYRETVRRDPLDPPVLNEAAGFLTEVGEAAEAEQLLERSLSLRQDASTLVRLGEARLAQRDEEGARAAAEQALALAPDNAAAKQLLARLF